MNSLLLASGPPPVAHGVASANAGWTWMGSGSPSEWLVFTAIVVVMLFLDLVVMNRGDKPVSVRNALLQTAVWVSVALGFGVWLFVRDGHEPAVTFLTGYLVEEALSVDNLFVFLVVFSYFKVKARHQRRVLFWGILSAAVLRGILIFLGTALVERFHWILYFFGAFLLYSAYKLLTAGDDEVEPEKNPVLKLIRRFIPMSKDYDGARFTTRVNGKRVATPLLAVLAVVETTDVVFALDSVPAIFAITTDPFLIYTSNIFAISGLRALYFALSAMMGKFRYLNVGLSLVLAFVGLKMLTEKFIEIPILASLGVIAACLTGSIVASLLNPEKEEPKPPQINPSGAFPATGPSTPADSIKEPAEPAKS